MTVINEQLIKYNLLDSDLDMKSLINNPNKEYIEQNNFLIYKKWIHKNKIYNVIKYNKDKLEENSKYGLYRSIIFSNGEINVFSPPKSIKFNNFINIYNTSQCYAEEIIEGTMINLFYDKELNEWVISTKGTVGGKIRFFKEQENFDVIFNEIIEELNININEFNSEYIYSFVMQHKKNKLVLPINETKLYLIEIYKINNYEILEIPREKYSELNINNHLNKISLPNRFYIHSYNDLLNNYGTMNTDIKYVGIMIKSYDGARTKIINPNYIYVKNLRGNNSKLQFQYLSLRKDKKLKEYLYYFPEHINKFNQFKLSVHNFTKTLYSNYINCYIKKQKPLIEYSSNFRTHMYNIHQIYLQIKNLNQCINKTIVIEYINKLDPALLMYSMNYCLQNLGEMLVEHEKLLNK